MLVAGGVRHVVLCPGSRSSALAYVLEAADRAGLLRLHVRVDERSAGFLALGLAKRTRVPAPVVTTSGTAVANLHPAVLEAHHARVPMLVLSADRPAELRGTGANQTTVQPGIFGIAVDHEVDLPPESPWAGRLADALAHASNAAAPVHANLQFREPLVPGTDALANLVDNLPLPAAEVARSRAPGRPSPPDVRRPTVRALPRATRPLLVVGDVPEPALAEAVVDWAARLGMPVVSEPFGTQPLPHAVAAGSLLLTDADWVAFHEPDLVVVVGRPTLTRPVTTLLRRAPRVVAVDSGVEFGVPGRELTRVAPDRLPDLGPDVDESWAEAWADRGRQVAQRLGAADLPWPSSPAVARVLTRALPPGSRLFLGSSNAVRDVDLVGDFAGADVDVVASRGLAGIDGCVSTSVGLALADPGRPTYALLGDLTLLHDTNGLLIGPSEPGADLTIVVPNDDGGGIFTLLEPGEPAVALPFERVFGTPTGTDLGALCRAHGIRHERVVTAERLSTALAEPPRGLTVLEVPVDRTTHRDVHEQLRRLARDA